MRIDIEQGKYKGHVIIPDFLNILQVRKFEDSLGDLNTAEPQADEKRIWLSLSDERRLPVCIDIVQEWHVENIPEQPTIETFPMTPLKDAHEVINKVFNGLFEVWTGETVPKD